MSLEEIITDSFVMKQINVSEYFYEIILITVNDLIFGCEWSYFGNSIFTPDFSVNPT